VQSAPNEGAPPQVPISVNIIVKNASASIVKCLDSLKDGFLRRDDEVLVVDTGSTDNTVHLCLQWGAKVIKADHLRKDLGALVREWLPEHAETFAKDRQFDQGCLLNFAEARQIALEASKHDAIFWIDADDTYKEEMRGQFRAWVDQMWGRLDSFFMNYYYAFDQVDGQLITLLKRERVVDRRNYVWLGRCHETLCPKPGVKIRGAGFNHAWNGGIFHTDGRKENVFGDIRNYCIIRKEMEEDLAAGREPDVRSIFYLGNASRGLGHFSETLQMYAKTLQLSGSRDDRFSAAYYSAVVYLDPRYANPFQARRMAYRCLDINPGDPRTYYLMARIFSLMGRHEDALHWFRCGRGLRMTENMVHSYDPEHTESLPLLTALADAKEMYNAELVTEIANELKKGRGQRHKDIQAIIQSAENWIRGMRLIESLKVVAQNTAAARAIEPAIALRELVQGLPAIPEELEKAGIGKIETPDPRPTAPNGPIDILGTATDEAWGPLSTKTGIGGSEKMVLLMAPLLQARGFNVTVYASVPREQRGVDLETGVRYEDLSSFDQDLPRKHLILWRNYGAAPVLRSKVCGKLICWFHDVMSHHTFSPEVIAAVDQFWVLSRYHRTTVPGIPEAKIRYTRNGIVPSLFRANRDKERKQNRVIYCSSPDRGALSAIRAFQEAYRDDPAAELVICYGFTKVFWRIAKTHEYCFVPDMNRDVSYYDYAETLMAAAAADPRIKFLGRVNWERLAELMCTSGVWFYPTRFDEISCMSAMEAQAAGLRIVATDRAPLGATVNWALPGTWRTVPETAAAALLSARKDETAPTESLSEWALTAYSIEGLADDWVNLLTT